MPHFPSTLPQSLQGMSVPVSFPQAEMIIKEDFVECKGSLSLNVCDGVSVWFEYISTLYGGGKHSTKRLMGASPMKLPVGVTG